MITTCHNTILSQLYEIENTFYIPLEISQLLLLETSLEINAVQTAPSHCPLDILLKYFPVSLQVQSSLFVQRVLGIGFLVKFLNKVNISLGVTRQEKVLKTVDDGVDGENRLPVLPEDVETHVALQVNVRVIDFSLALHLLRTVEYSQYTDRTTFGGS